MCKYFSCSLYRKYELASNRDELFADVQIWFDECRKLGCPSEYECFLRRPDNNCIDSSCAHTADCTLTAGPFALQ